MKRSVLFAIAAFAIASAYAVAEVVQSAWKVAKSWLGYGLKEAFAPSAASIHPAPGISLHQAKSFVQRIVKRDRPQVTSGWRWCPSV